MLEKEIAQLTKWKQAYYDGVPLVSDTEFDKLYDKTVKQLHEKDPTNPFLKSVGAPVSGGWEK